MSIASSIVIRHIHSKIQIEPPKNNRTLHTMAHRHTTTVLVIGSLATAVVITASSVYRKKAVASSSIVNDDSDEKPSLAMKLLERNLVPDWLIIRPAPHRGGARRSRITAGTSNGRCGDVTRKSGGHLYG